MLAKDELLDRVVDRVRDQMPEDRASQAEEFVRQYYSWIPREDLEGRSTVDLYGAAMAHFSFAFVRAAGEPKIRVYNPVYEEHGWQSTHTVLEIVTDDMPFLVDSTRMEVNARGFAIHLMLHPIMKVRRDDEGRIAEVLPAGSEDALSESVIHVEVDRQTETEVLDELLGCTERVLNQVRAAVEDWPAMVEAVREIEAGFEENPPPIGDEDLAEARAFLDWIADNNFTFLGYREYELTTENGEDALMSVEGTGLGILRQAGGRPASRSFAKLPAEVRQMARKPTLLNLTKANSRSTVHRPSYMDYVGVKQFDENDEPIGERRFLGLYTFSAYSMSAFDIPIVRRKVRYVLEQA
ncbi:MAG: NAD-glutamate dehydrogenase, partial [Rubrobacter sp.]